MVMNYFGYRNFIQLMKSLEGFNFFFFNFWGGGVKEFFSFFVAPVKFPNVPNNISFSLSCCLAMVKLPCI